MRQLLLNSPNSYAIMLKVFLSSDHVTAATGKTVAVKISKAGGAFADPFAGATNAAEVSNGWYSVTLGTDDLDTEGDLVVRGTATGCDDSEQVCQVGDVWARDVSSGYIGNQAGSILFDQFDILDASLNTPINGYSWHDAIAALHTLHGLSIPDPVTVTPTLRTAGTISQTLSGDGVTTKTVTRTA